MTRVDFYVLGDVDALAKRRFACRLAQRATQAGQRVHVRAEEEAIAALENLMWDYPPDGFLPHARLAAADGEPITLGGLEEKPASGQVLVNLAADVPEFFAGFARVAEVVLGTERAAGRSKYRQYRERGYPLFHHELDDWE